MKKRGAIELTTSTIVIVVLAIAMLILGFVLVNKSVCAAIHGIESIDDKMKAELTSMFAADQKVVVKETSNEIMMGVWYGVGFAIRNEGKDPKGFSYQVEVVDNSNCKMSKEEALNLIKLGKKGDISQIANGEEYAGLIRFEPPKSGELCNLRYRVVVQHANSEYGFEEFDVKLVRKSFTSSMC